MAQWAKLLKLDPTLRRQVIQLYDEENFPREIRSCLSDWIENQNWDLAAADEGEARDCFDKFMHQLDEQDSRSAQENFLEGPSFSRIKHDLQHRFEMEPLSLAKIISKCLHEERTILSKDGIPNDPVMERQKELDNKVKEIKKQIRKVEQGTKSLEDQQEEHDFRLKAWQNQVEQLNGADPSMALQKERLHINTVLNTLNNTKRVVSQLIVDILQLADQIVSSLISVELPEWKVRQQSACIGARTDTSIDQLQMWFTAVAEVLQQLCQQLKKLQEQEQKYASNKNVITWTAQFEEYALHMFKVLLENALVVERQPSMQHQQPLILKTKVRFTVKIRFLAKLPEFNWKLKVKPVFDKDVSETTTIHGFRKFVFTTSERNISKVMDLEDSSGGLVAEFSRLSVEQQDGSNRSNEQSPLAVTEELHVIKFLTQLQLPGLKLDIETSSLPVVVVSSTNQIPSAWASIVWCNMLNGEPKNLSLFLNPPPVTWQQLSEVLNWQLLSISKQGLEEYQLSMLREKFVDNADGLVHWTRFCKNEGAWMWLAGILDLIKKHLLDLWNDGSIMGFVSRETAKVLLNNMPAGTFLLRFSESSKEGAITFSWVEHSNGEPTVRAVMPYTKKDLTTMTLPDTIYNYYLEGPSNIPVNPLLNLYPDIPKEHAFGRYYTKTESPRHTAINGYLERRSVHLSIMPTPPPSPPEDTSWMEVTDGVDIPIGDESQFNPDFADVLYNLKRGLCE
ncbi:signal transducer and activator of transcription 1-alpha/beta-like isoform 1-T2 [Polymixia lowei]